MTSRGLTKTFRSSENPESERKLPFEDVSAKGLPSWDLTTMYRSPEDPEIERELKSYERHCSEFSRQYEGKTHTLDDKGIVHEIDTFLSRVRQGSRLQNYANMFYSQDMQDAERLKLYHKIERRLWDADHKGEFIYRELASLPDERVKQFMDNPDVSRKHKHFVQMQVDDRQYQLSADAEKVSSRMHRMNQLTGSDTYEYVKSGMTFPLKLPGNTRIRNVDFSTVSDMANTNPDPATRKVAFQTLVKELSRFSYLFESQINNGILANHDDQRLRRYKNPATQWNLSDDITDDKIPEKVVKTIEKSRVMPRYYTLKTKMTGKKALNPWDVEAPLPDAPPKTYSWEEAQDLITRAMQKFHPKMGELAKQAFSERWIDAAPNVGKYPGLGSTWPSADDSHPFVLVNWHGSQTDLMVLAHELGHAITMHINATSQNNFLDESTFFIAEFTALTAEQLVFNELKERAKTPKQKRLAQVQYLDNAMFHLRRASEYDFALGMYKDYKKKKEPYFDSDDIDKRYQTAMEKCYGDSVTHLEKMGPLWMARGHLFDDPFYLIDYPAPALMVAVMFDKAQKGEIKNLPERYMELMQKGGTDYSFNMLRDMGLDVQEKGFWHRGTTVIHKEIDELERLREAEKSANTERSHTARLEDKKQKSVRSH